MLTFVVLISGLISMTQSTITSLELASLLVNFGFKHPQKLIQMLLTLLELLVDLHLPVLAHS